jgi:hypothetical protein
MATDTNPPRGGRLLELAVTDLAQIDRLRLGLEPGLNVLTGETGAGKSLLIDALGLALGARADTTLVRHGAEGARVEALFDRLPEPLIAVREVAASGRSVARLDDETVTAGRLAAATGDLVEIHGQHEQQRLLDDDWQRDLVDAYGGHGDARARVAAAVERWRANRAALAELSMEPRELLRRLDILEHEAAEIAAAGVRDGGGGDHPAAGDRPARRDDHVRGGLGPRDPGRRGARGPRCRRPRGAGAPGTGPPGRAVDRAGGPAGRRGGRDRGRRGRGPDARRGGGPDPATFRA